MVKHRKMRDQKKAKQARVVASPPKNGVHLGWQEDIAASLSPPPTIDAAKYNKAEKPTREEPLEVEGGTNGGYKVSN